MTNPSKTTVIFVPGAWHSPKVFELVGYLLESAGYKTDYVDLVSVGPEKPLAGVEDDSERIRSHITSAVEAGQDVVVVMHSYGGVPTQDAVKGLDKESRLQNNQDGGVSHLFFCCSFVLDEGVNLWTVGGNAILPWFQYTDSGTEYIPKTPEETFYNGLDEIQAKAAAAKLKPHSANTSYGVVHYAAWKHIPCSYLHCLQDRAIPVEAQKMMVEQTAGGAGIKFNTYTLDTGHSPFYTMPEETAKAIRQAAGEQL